ncbi:MAG TPA: TolC family protein, partial [Gemmatimonadales bacterium]|nr:TolC family protein [Gemmatimonadales bacterium]
AEGARVARRTLAGVVGLPAGRDSSLEVAPTQWPPCGADSADRAALQRSALESRWNVRRAAAEYQVAEGDLRLQVANASPDLTLGPGLFFDQGTGKFTLGLGLPSLQLTRNRGPIAEAEARRRLAGARLLQEQETVLTEVDSALTRCAAVTDEATSVAALVREAEQRRDLVRAAWARGETGRLEMLTADLELRRAQREALDAGRRQREAGLGLDLALGAWGLRQDGDWPRREER